MSDAQNFGGVRIVPQLSVRRGREAVEFYKTAFGAVDVYRVGGTDDNPDVVAELSIGGASFWVSDEAPASANFSPESVGGPSSVSAARWRTRRFTARPNARTRPNALRQWRRSLVRLLRILVERYEH